MKKKESGEENKLNFHSIGPEEDSPPSTLRSPSNFQVENIELYLKSYKRKFLGKLFFGLLLVLALFFQIFFYNNLYPFENDLIASLQTLLLPAQPSQLLIWLFRFVKPFYVNLLVLHLIMGIYYGTDAILGMKLMVNNLVCLSLNKIILLIHQDDRPYWNNPSAQPTQVQGYGCMTTFSNPDLMIMQLVMISLLIVDSNRQLAQVKSDTKISNIFPTIGLVSALVLFLLNYIGGEVFLVSLITIPIYCIVLMLVMKAIDSKVSKIIRKNILGTNRQFWSSNISHLLILIITMVAEVLFLLGDNAKNEPGQAIFNYVPEN
jgi:hypothetical protein